jgi:sterol 14alpha-demethylase
MQMEETRVAAPLPLAPKLKGGLPLLGHTIDFLRDTQGLMRRAAAEVGPVARFRVVGKDMVLLTGPTMHEAFFRAPDEQLSPSEAYKMMVPVFGKGVAYDNEGPRMVEQLHMLLPALQDQRMRTYGGVIAKEVDESLAAWGDAGERCIVEYAQTLTNFTSSHCLLGREFRQEMTEEWARVYHDLERGIVPIGYIHPYLPIPAFRRRDRARARLGEMVSEVVERRRKSGYVGEDFLQTLMESKYKDGSSLSDHEITGMLVAAMFAGHHTSGVTTAWTLIELLRHPEELALVKQEIDEVYAEDPELTFPSLRKLKRTEWAVKEALRLHPPLFILLRAALQDFEVEGYRIPKGTWCIVSPIVAHELDEVFAGALEFDPSRYDKPRQEDKRPFAYISFGGGRHKCMGNAFAILQIKTIMAKLLHEYDFSLSGDPIETDFSGLVLGPKLPCRVKYTRRA